jgi:disulfide bond formation protein DsbB
MDPNTVTLFFALLALVCDAFVLATGALWLTRSRAPRRWSSYVDTVGPNAFVLGAVVAIVATAGSLYLSEVAHFAPCRLCWYQRIGMYPLGVLLVVAALRRDVRAWIYPFVLSLLALPISVYHVLLEHYPSLETGACERDNPCSIVWVRHFGVVTIPFMAGSAFAAIAVAMAVAGAWNRKEHSDVRNTTARATVAA